MRKFFLCIFLLSSYADAQDLRQEISKAQKKKVDLFLEKKKLLEDSVKLEKDFQDFSLSYDKKKDDKAQQQKEMSKNLSLLIRLGRLNPLHLIVDSKALQNTVREIILVRAFITSLKHHMHHVEAELNELNTLTKDIKTRDQSQRQLLQNIELQQDQVALVENETIENWTKSEQDRLAQEEDANVLLEESRAALSKTERAARVATAERGLPFRRLERPVMGKILEDPALQETFSPHSQGIVFETKKKAVVLAPSQGTVIFRGPFRTQGEILILNHGKDVHTILMGMHKINVQVGEIVYGGKKLGEMAGYGAEPPKLYIELRQKGKAIDPQPYFAN